MLTAAVRDLHRCYPRQFLTDGFSLILGAKQASHPHVAPKPNATGLFDLPIGFPRNREIPIEPPAFHEALARDGIDDTGCNSGGGKLVSGIGDFKFQACAFEFPCEQRARQTLSDDQSRTAPMEVP